MSHSFKSAVRHLMEIYYPKSRSDFNENLLPQKEELSMSDSRRATQGEIFARECYEAHTGLRALERAGQCRNLHGHVHELMVCDKFNINPKNILQGKQAALSTSATDPLHDVVVTKDGRFLEGFQLKDTASSSGVQKTLHQINSGKYNGTTVVGTEETAAKLAGKTARQVKSSGISSETTKRIADKALGRIPTASALGSVAKSGSMMGAAVGAGVEAVSSVIDVLDGKKSVGDAVIDVGGAAIKGGVTGAGSAAAGSLAAGATGAALATVGITCAAAPIVAGFAVACGVGSFISSWFD